MQYGNTYNFINFNINLINCFVFYADDAVLFTDDPTKWDYVFRNFEASAGVMGLHTNWHKTKIQNISTRSRKSKARFAARFAAC